MAEMTELERAKQTRDAIYWGLYAIERQAPNAPTYRPVPPLAYEATVRMHELWKREVNILEAAAKEGEPTHDVLLQSSISDIRKVLYTNAKVVAELTARFDRHDHGMNTQTGPPNVDRETGDERKG